MKEVNLTVHAPCGIKTKTRACIVWLRANHMEQYVLNQQNWTSKRRNVKNPKLFSLEHSGIFIFSFKIQSFKCRLLTKKSHVASNCEKQNYISETKIIQYEYRSLMSYSRIQQIFNKFMWVFRRELGRMMQTRYKKNDRFKFRYLSWYWL